MNEVLLWTHISFDFAACTQPAPAPAPVLTSPVRFAGGASAPDLPRCHSSTAPGYRSQTRHPQGCHRRFQGWPLLAASDTPPHIMGRTIRASHHRGAPAAKWVRGDGCATHRSLSRNEGGRCRRQRSCEQHGTGAGPAAKARTAGHQGACPGSDRVHAVHARRRAVERGGQPRSSGSSRRSEHGGVAA